VPPNTGQTRPLVQSVSLKKEPIHLHLWTQTRFKTICMLEPLDKIMVLCLWQEQTTTGQIKTRYQLIYLQEKASGTSIGRKQQYLWKQKSMLVLDVQQNNNILILLKKHWLSHDSERLLKLDLIYRQLWICVKSFVYLISYTTIWTIQLCYRWDKLPVGDILPGPTTENRKRGRLWVDSCTERVLIMAR